VQNHAVGEQVRSARMIAFILGISIILIALVVPMDIFGMYSMFTVHMIQHLLLSLAVPPLLILSIPPGHLRQILGAHARIERGMGLHPSGGNKVKTGVEEENKEIVLR